MKIISLLALLLLVGCGDTQQTIINQPGSQVGDITGKVQLFDSVQLAPDFSGVRVSLEGTNVQSVSDAAGKWTLKDVPAGTYIISFDKQGYSLKRYFNFQYTGNGTYYFDAQTLHKRPAVTTAMILRPLVGYYNGKDTSYYADITVTVSSGLKYYLYYSGAVVCFSHDPQIDVNDPHTYDYYTAYSRALPDSLGIEVYTYVDDLKNVGFRPGDKVYCKSTVVSSTYPGASAYFNLEEYYDPRIDNYVLTGTSRGGSEVRSFILQ